MGSVGPARSLPRWGWARHWEAQHAGHPATAPHTQHPSKDHRTVSIPREEVVLGGPCVHFVKSYLKRDYNPATDIPTESMDRGTARAHSRSTWTYRHGENGGESCGSFRVQRQVQGKAPDESQRSL